MFKWFKKKNTAALSELSSTPSKSDNQSSRIFESELNNISEKDKETAEEFKAPENIDLNKEPQDSEQENLNGISGYNDWRGRLSTQNQDRRIHWKDGWNISFPHLVEGLSYIPDSSKPKENIVISEYNAALDKLKAKAIQNKEQWHENKTEETIIELIEIMDRLIVVSKQNVAFKEILAFYLVLAGIAVKTSEQSTIYLKRAVKLMEAILEDLTHYLTAPNKADFRKDIIQTFEVLWQSDPKNIVYYILECKRLNAKFPEFNFVKPDNYSVRFFWTEARLQKLIYFKNKNMTFDQIARQIFGVNRNRVLTARVAQGIFRVAPNEFGRT